jgi:hypothetical protein
VQRVELVLHEELPVRLLDHAVADGHDLHLADRRAVAHVVEGHLGVAEEFEQRRTFARQAREDEAAVAVDARHALHPAVRVVACHVRAFVALGQRDRAHAAVEVEAPRVVRAHEGAAGVSALVADDLHAAVRAPVEEHLHAAVVLSHHQERLAADGDGVVVARRLHLRFVAAIHPHTLEDAVHLEVEDRGVGVDALVHPIRFDELLQVHRSTLS